MKLKIIFILSICVFSLTTSLNAQYTPKKINIFKKWKAKHWVNKQYKSLSQDEKLGQLFIVALYTNKGDEHIEQVRNLVVQEQLGGLILMQDDATKHINLINEFQSKSKIPLLIGMDAEWGLFQRIKTAKKFPWAMTLGAIQDKKLIEEMASKIAEDAKRMGVNWNFAPVVDVNTNPENPIIGNRSFGSEVDNVIQSALAYSKGLQNNNVLAAIKHFPGHGDTSTDSHLDLPVVSHNLERLENIELAPFKALMNQGIGGVMVAHLYVPALEKQEEIPASISKNIITNLLKEKYGYKGLIITDALNMGAVAKRFKPGELDAMAFKAGNDIMLFSDGVKEGKRLIQEAIDNKIISQKRVEESVKKILLTKYYLGLHQQKPIISKDINQNINNNSHTKIIQKIYSNAFTLLKDDKLLLPLNPNETYYYLPLEEAPYETFAKNLINKINLKVIEPNQIESIPPQSKVIIGFHKDNSTAYKSYKISEQSKSILKEISKNNQVLLNVFGSPYTLKDIDIKDISTVVVSYENNDDSMIMSTEALVKKNSFKGKLSVDVNANIKAGDGIIMMEKNN